MLPAMITKIQQAFKEIKDIQCDTWEGDYRPATRDALKEIFESRMGQCSRCPFRAKANPRHPGSPKRPLPSPSPYGARGSVGKDSPHPNLQRQGLTQTLPRRPSPSND